MSSIDPGTEVSRPPVPRPSAARTAATPSPGAPRTPGTPAVPKQRPDARPMRLGLAAGGIAALSIMVSGLLRFPAPDPVTVADDGALAGDTAAAAPQRVKVEKRIRYVQLKRGQKAPPGAKVIDAAQPTPRVVVTRIQAPAKRKVRIVTRTRQSGR